MVTRAVEASDTPFHQRLRALLDEVKDQAATFAERVGVEKTTVRRWLTGGQWTAEVMELPGVIVSEATCDEAIAAAKALALRVIADCIEHGEPVPEGIGAVFAAPDAG